MTETFTVHNFKGCREVTLSPEGSLVVVAGANGAGKSSFIDAFVELFDPRGIRLTPRPIHDGAATAEAVYENTELGYRITRRWTKNDSGTLTVTALDGAKYSKPTELVRDLTGGIIFDPVDFLKMDDKKQRDALLAKVNLPFDLEALERQKAATIDRRVEAGREVKRLEGLAASLPTAQVMEDAEEVSAQDILADLERAQEANREREQAESANMSAARAVHEIEAQIAKLQEDLAAARAVKDRMWKRLAEAPEFIPLDGIRARLANVEEENKRVREAKAWYAAQSDLRRAEALHAGIKAEIDVYESTKREGLLKAQFPVDGLSVDDDGITFDGVPFSQVNSAARLKTAFAIATAGDPQLKLVIIKDGDLLDSTSLDAIREMADERAYTVLVERDRDESRQIGFTIVDGALEGAQPAVNSDAVWIEPGCVTCENNRGKIAPPHHASKNCQSGGRDHCGCEVCF